MTTTVLSFTPNDLIPKGLQSPNLVGTILEEIYPIAKRSILKQYDAATKVTPYEASMLGVTKRSGKKVTNAAPPNPPFGFDTGAFRSDLERLKLIDAATLFIYSDVFYAEYLLNKFAQKSPIGGIGIQETELSLIELNITNQVVDLWLSQKELK